MPKRIKHGKRPADVNEFVHYRGEAPTQEGSDGVAPPTKAQISLVMAELGRRGGKKGGKRRLETMTPKQRSTAARRAAQARWKIK
jgi:hypothetical protein